MNETDEEIIALFLARDEQALVRCTEQYGRYCRVIAARILPTAEDSEEIVNDTWLRAWEAIPPVIPSSLSAYLGKITRNLALNRAEKLHAKKRGAFTADTALEELAECLPAPGTPHAMLENRILAARINAFLDELSDEARQFFLHRYFYLTPVKEIAAAYHCGESKVKMSLKRSRAKLKQILLKEGLYDE